MSMYVRLKRRNQTIFLHVEGSYNFGQIKQKVAEILSLPDPSKIMLLASDKKREFLDLATISDQEVHSDDIIYMVFQREGGGGWEELVVDELGSVEDISKSSGQLP